MSFIDIDKFLCDALDNNDDIEDIIFVILQSIIIIDLHYHILSEELENSLQFDEVTYELQVLFYTCSDGYKQRDGGIYSCRVGQSIGWWYQRRNDNVGRHSNFPV